MAASPLERITDHVQRIANVASRMKHPVKGNVMADIEDLNNAYAELVKQSIEVLFDADTSLANQVIDSIDNMHARVEELHASVLKMEFHEVMISLGTIMDSLSRIGDFGSNIDEIAINSAIRDK
jgi:phosphate uptake regulator